MTTQKQWHGSPGGTLTITSFLSQSLRWLMKRKSKGQLWYSGAPPSSSSSLTWTRWESPLKCRRWSLQSSGDGISLTSCTQKSKYDVFNSSLAFKLSKYQKRIWKSSCSIVQQTSVTDFNLCSGAGQHPRQWGEGEDHLQQVGHSQREVSLIMTRPQLHGQSRIPSKLLWIYNQLKHGPCSELHGSLWTISQTCLNLWLWPGTWPLPWAASSSILARRCLPIAPRFLYDVVWYRSHK